MLGEMILLNNEPSGLRTSTPLLNCLFAHFYTKTPKNNGFADPTMVQVRETAFWADAYWRAMKGPMAWFVLSGKFSTWRERVLTPITCLESLSVRSIVTWPTLFGQRVSIWFFTPKLFCGRNWVPSDGIMMRKYVRAWQRVTPWQDDQNGV